MWDGGVQQGSLATPQCNVSPLASTLAKTPPLLPCRNATTPVALRPARSAASPAAAMPGTSYAKPLSRLMYMESSPAVRPPFPAAPPSLLPPLPLLMPSASSIRPK